MSELYGENFNGGHDVVLNRDFHLNELDDQFFWTFKKLNISPEDIVFKPLNKCLELLAGQIKRKSQTKEVIESYIPLDSANQMTLYRNESQGFKENMEKSNQSKINICNDLTKDDILFNYSIIDLYDKIMRLILISWKIPVNQKLDLLKELELYVMRYDNIEIQRKILLYMAYIYLEEGYVVFIMRIVRVLSGIHQLDQDISRNRNAEIYALSMAIAAIEKNLNLAIYWKRQLDNNSSGGVNSMILVASRSKFAMALLYNGRLEEALTEFLYCLTCQESMGIFKPKILEIELLYILSTICGDSPKICALIESWTPRSRSLQILIELTSDGSELDDLGAHSWDPIVNDWIHSRLKARFSRRINITDLLRAHKQLYYTDIALVVHLNPKDVELFLRKEALRGNIIAHCGLDHIRLPSFD